MSRSLVLAGLFLLVGCAHALTQTEITQYGTQTYEAPSAKVFAAAVKALEIEGYEVPLQNPESGKIRTSRKMLREDTTGNQHRAISVAVTRQYYVDVKAGEDGKTIVSARPLIYQGETDLSDRDVWILEGPSGERALWQKLFKDIADQL